MNLADFLSLQSFFNSYLIQHPDALKNNLEIQIQRQSLTGFSLFKTKDNFEDFIHRIVQKENIDKSKKEIFLERIIKSHRTIQALIEKNIHSFSGINQFSTAENLGISGHYAHPYPKLTEDTNNLNSGHHFLENAILLKWCLIKKEHLQFGCSKKESIEHYLTSIAKMYQQEIDYDKNLYALLPMHPVQLEFIQNNSQLDFVEITEVESNTHWIKTSSVRSLFHPQMPWMIKYSLPIRITNSIRNLQKSEVERGIMAYEVLNSHPLKEQIATDSDLNSLEIMHEPFYWGIKKNEQLVEETIGLLRFNPIEKEENTFVLNYLNQIYNVLGERKINELIAKYAHTSQLSYFKAATIWFQTFLENIIRPLIILQARYGIYLGAHQQNLIIKVDHTYLPIKAYYRDCQGTGYNPEVFTKNAIELTCPIELRKNIISQDFATHLFTYYVMINSTLYTIASIAKGDLSLEKMLIEKVQKLIVRLDELKMPNENDFFYQHLLKSENLFVKNNYLCCLKNLNENQLDNPLDIYSPTPNLFARNYE